LISSASVFHRYPPCCSPVFLVPAVHHQRERNGRCNAFVSSHGARIQTSRSSSVITGIENLQFADGTVASATFALNHAPQISLPSGTSVQGAPGQIFQPSSLFTTADADHDELTYFIYDGTADASSGHFVVNGTVVSAGVSYALSCGATCANDICRWLRFRRSFRACQRWSGA
jgi:hypothetical protein